MTMNQSDAVTAAQSLIAEAERLRADAQAIRREADALRSAVQGPSEVVQQVSARLGADADMKIERAYALERVAANLLSKKVGRESGSVDGLAILDAFAKADLSGFVARLGSAVRGQGYRVGQAGPIGSAPIDMQAISKILEDGLQWLAKGGRGPGRPP